jgi:hypothetical protein
MRIGIICSPDYLPHIRNELSGQLILLERAGLFHFEEFDAQITSAINVSLDVLVVDITCADDDAIVKGLRKYRITKSARVIVIAPGRSPGDITMSKLVADGIYDIIAPPLPEEDDEASSFEGNLGLQNTINQEYHMGNAARWRIYQDDEAEKERQKIKLPDINFDRIKGVFSGSQKVSGLPGELEEDFDLIDDDSFVSSSNRTEVIERFIGTVTIAVFSGIKRTGCSFTAIQVANWLSQKYRTAYVEMESNSSNFYRSFKSERKPSYFMVGNLTIYPGRSQLEEILFEDWEYLVIDFGSTWKNHLPSFARSHVHILTAFGSDMDATADILNDLFEGNWKRPINLVVTATEQGFKEWTEAVTRKEKRDMQLHFWKQSLCDHPFQNGPLPVHEMLSSVLPKHKPGFLKFFKR